MEKNSPVENYSEPATALARAKVNLFLEVIERRPDSYHNLESVFAEIDLADSLTLRVIPEKKILLACDHPDLPLDRRNLVYQAAEVMGEKYGWRSGLVFSLQKRIPAGGGLGGGSSDAATALRLIEAAWRLGAGREELAGLALRLGSDVPFFLQGGVCICRGRGELIEPLAGIGVKGPLHLGLVISGIFSGTAAAYRGLHLPEAGKARGVEAFREAWLAGDRAGMEREAFNRFAGTVLRDIPELGRLRERLAEEIGRGVHLSGSGSGLWFYIWPGEEELWERWKELVAGLDAELRVVRVV